MCVADDGCACACPVCVLQGDELLEDAELGRVVQPWRAAQVEVVREALLRYGADRLDKVVAQVSHGTRTRRQAARRILQHCPCCL